MLAIDLDGKIYASPMAKLESYYVGDRRAVDCAFVSVHIQILQYLPSTFYSSSANNNTAETVRMWYWNNMCVECKTFTLMPHVHSARRPFDPWTTQQKWVSSESKPWNVSVTVFHSFNNNPGTSWLVDIELVVYVSIQNMIYECKF